jgi:hypothetical protein
MNLVSVEGFLGRDAQSFCHNAGVPGIAGADMIGYLRDSRGQNTAEQAGLIEELVGKIFRSTVAASQDTAMNLENAAWLYCYRHDLCTLRSTQGSIFSCATLRQKLVSYAP